MAGHRHPWAFWRHPPPPSLPGFLPFPHRQEELRTQQCQQSVKKGQPGVGELVREAGVCSEQVKGGWFE